MTIGERIKKRRVDLGLSVDYVAEKIKKDRATVYRYEADSVEKMPTTVLVPLAEVLRTTPAYLMGWEEDDALPTGARPIKRKYMPVLGNVACGEPIYASEEYGVVVDALDDLDADFCLVATGDSMINARIFDGDVLAVKKQEIVDDGEIAVVLVGDEATVKRVYYDRENNVITLVPENPMYKQMRFEGSELDQIRILGKVVSGQYLI